jgi:DNA-binding transcriptional ArsR family regulator
MKRDEAMKNNLMGKTFMIGDLETLRVMADPLRGQIYEQLVLAPQTVKQVAEKLGLAPGKLYYHISLLEKHGLIQVVETRLVANMVEKLYRANAGKLDIDPDLLQFSTPSGKENIYALLTSLLDATKADLSRSLEARAAALERGADPHPREVVVNRLTARLPEARANEFTRQVVALFKEFTEADEGENGDAGELQAYSLTVAFYPSYYFPEESQGE